MDFIENFVYFRDKNGIMKMLEIPKFGTIELIVNDGKIVATETTERKHY